MAYHLGIEHLAVDIINKINESKKAHYNKYLKNLIGAQAEGTIKKTSKKTSKK